MSKLIGTNPNQVPSNADLGTAAFMDKKDFLLSKGSSLSAIDAVIPKTAVDVFVYDTSKDSDGGAWRKRTQHTSWYNERLNTPTRGSRREFPAVAILVLQSGSLTIYDGDDPSLPMWMVFNQGTNYAIGGTSSSLSCVNMLNGILYVGRTTNGFKSIYFVSDTHFFGNKSSGYFTYANTISRRNNDDGYIQLSGSGYLVGDPVNDIAMTVLPNAPIDPETGLPVPTIAVATSGAVSVIKDNGTVVDYLHAAGSNFYISRYIGFDKNNNLLVQLDSSSASRRLYVVPITDSDTTVNNSSSYPVSPTILGLGGISDVTDGNYDGNLIGINTNSVVSVEQNELAISDSVTGMSLVDYNYNTDRATLAYISSSYNTGWMIGDTRLATLCDTDTRDAGTAYDHSGITFRDGARFTSHTYVTGAKSWQVVDDPNNASVSYFGLTIPTVKGVTYTVYHTMDQTYEGASEHHIQHVEGDDSFDYFGGGDQLSDSITFIAQGSETRYVVYSANDVTTTHTIDIVYGVPNRTADGVSNLTHMEPYGIIKKTPVAPGADLVAYSGFTSGDYNGVRLEQPYDAGINPGSGDYSISFWLRDVGAGTDVMGLGKRGTDLSWNIYHDAAGGLRLTVSYNGTTYQSLAEIQFGGAIDQWSHVVYTKVGNVYSAYLNGNFYISTQGTSDTLYTTSRPFMIGSGHTNNNIVGDPKYALLRISKTAPTPEQVKKIYEDEKVLFQENAKATLYGTSDAITALAYDDDTNLLHVGTSAGRSVFQGLRRVDNTTRAVGTAISAVDGFVVEE